MEFLNNILYIKNNHASCKKSEQEFENTVRNNEQTLKKINPDAKIKKEALKYGKVLTDNINTIDSISINKSENAAIVFDNAAYLFSLGLSALSGLGGYLFSSLRKNTAKSPKQAAFIAYSIASLITISISDILSADFRKLATRVARFQTRKDELKNLNNFVVYSDEQIKDAQKTAENLPEVKDVTEDLSMKASLNPIKVYKNALKTYIQIKNDYKNCQKNVKLISGKIPKHYNEKELKQAEKDKFIVLNTIKNVEFEANNYEINAITTAKIFTDLATIIGLSVGFLSSNLIGKIKMPQNKLLKNSAKVLSKVSIPFAIIGVIFMSLPFAKLSKEAAKTGHFNAQKKLLANYTNFMKADKTDATTNSTNNIPVSENKNEIFYNIKNEIKSIFNLFENFKDYNKYKKEKLQNDLKLKEALKKVKISNKQEEDAKKLQHHLFMAFEKIDEKSEAFVDDTNAALNLITRITGCIAATAGNIFTIKQLGKTLSNYTSNKQIPGFFESLKLCKNMKTKDIVKIFILPYVLTRIPFIFVELFSARIKKEACKTGITDAIRTLNKSEQFLYKSNTNNRFNTRISFNNFLKTLNKK